MTEKRIRVEKQIGRQTLSFETGQLAKQAAGSVLVQYGETVVLVATASSDPRPGLDFFPLTCDYRERLAAAGKFPWKNTPGTFAGLPWVTSWIVSAPTSASPMAESVEPVPALLA